MTDVLIIGYCILSAGMAIYILGELGDGYKPLRWHSAHVSVLWPAFMVAVAREKGNRMTLSEAAHPLHILLLQLDGKLHQPCPNAHCGTPPTTRG